MSEVMTEVPQALYRFFDASGELLYVGISVNPLGRWDQHRTKTWWRDIRTATIEPYSSREEVERAEVAAIQAERPRYNVHRSMVRRSAFIQRETWDAAKARAAKQGANISDIVRELVEDYVKRGGRR